MKNKNTILKTLLFILWIGQVATSFGQTPGMQSTAGDQLNRINPKPVPQSPNVASLGKYGIYNVNLYTGLPDISIPIYEATSGGLKVPVTLSYHAGGIRYTDQASWVGMGWSLSAGGQVSRITQGKPDEEYYFSHDLPIASVCSDYFKIQQEAVGGIDTEPDIFSYSFPGKSGKFHLGQYLGTVNTPYYLIPYEPIKLEPTFVSSQISNFKITGEDGVTYNYGTFETTGSDNGGVTTTSRTAWHLASMVAPNSDDQISFTYQDVGLAYIIDASEHITVTDLCTGTWVQCPTGLSSPTISNSVSTVEQYDIDEIFFEGGKVKFILGGRRNDQHASATLKSLDKIEIYGLIQGTYTKLKTYQFVYSYFTNTAANTDYRLKLNELQVMDASNAIVQKYVFSYYTNTFSWDVMTGSKRRDYLGYFNNKVNSTLIPSTDVNFQSTSGSQQTTITIGGGNRDTDTTYLKEGMLKTIQYPTGGYTEFKYEPHQYNENGVQYPGGLRIKKIVSYDGVTAQPLIKSYKYGDGETGNGVKNFFLSKSFFYSTQIFEYYVTDPNSGGHIYNNRVRTYTSGSSLSLDSYDGSPVVYPVVTEYEGDASGSNVGKTVYEYDNKSYEGDIVFVVPNSGKNYKDSKHWKRGMLTAKSVYNTIGSLVSKTTTSYQSFQTQNKTVGMGVATYIAYISSGPFFTSWPKCTVNGDLVDQMEFFVMNYVQSTGAFRQMTVTENIYESGDPSKFVSTSTTLGIDPTYLQVRETSVSGPNSGDLVINTSKYPFEFTYTGTETGTAKAIRELNEKNVLTTPVEQCTYKQIGGSNYIVGGQVNSFIENPSNTSEIILDKVFLLETSSSIPQASYTPTTLTSSALNMDSRYKEGVNMFFDSHGNVIQVQKTNDVYQGYQWGYSNTLPVAEVVNAQNNKYSYNQTSQSTGTASVSMGGSIVNSPHTVVSTYNFTVDYTGSVVLKLGVSGNPSYTTTATYSGMASGSFTVGKNGCGVTTITFTNVSPGAKSLTITLSTPDSGVSSLSACGQIDYPQNVTNTITTGITEFFYENFEETGNATAMPHTGKKYWSGNYTSTFIKPNSRNYIIEYWYLSSGVWQYATATYTNGMVLNAGIIDDVRIYPVDAQMKSYAYTPGLGMTSSIDERGQVFTYVYDGFGRLQKIVNESGGIEKQYTYQYKSN